MKRAVFEIKQTPTGSYYFTFRGTDGERRVVSSTFLDRAELEKCLSHVRETAPLSEVNEESFQVGKRPFFWVQSKGEEVMFSLIGFRGEIVFSSIPYAKRENCLEAIKDIKACAQRAAVVDYTID